MSSKSNLPSDLVECILSCLPPESLVRFECVRKSWLALFHDPNFISRHLSNCTKHNSRSSILLRFDLYNLKNHNYFCSKLYCISSSNQDAGFSAVETLDKKRELGEFPSRFRISGHCNGIVCLYYRYNSAYMYEDVALYNPATRDLRILPQSETASSDFVVGMSYDPHSNDYKVVKIGMASLYCGPIAFIDVEEYSLSTDSWRKREISNAGDFAVDFDRFAMHFEGVYYWWAGVEGVGRSIVALKDVKEIFHMLPMPAGYGGFDGYLGVLNESISLVFRTSIHDFCTFDVWVMDGFGFGADGCSWTKLQTIQLTSSVAATLAFWKGNELLMRQMSGQLQSYNIDTRETKNVDIEGLGHENFLEATDEAITYVKSIVSVLKGGS